MGPQVHAGTLLAIRQGHMRELISRVASEHCTCCRNPHSVTPSHWRGPCRLRASMSDAEVCTSLGFRVQGVEDAWVYGFIRATHSSITGAGADVRSGVDGSHALECYKQPFSSAIS